MRFLSGPSALLRSTVFVMFFALLVGADVMAQPTVSVRGNVGASFFRSPDVLSEALHSGVDLGLGAGVHIYRGLSLTVRGGYDRFTLNEETSRLFSRLEAGDLSFLSGSLGLRYTYRNSTDAHPYVATGIGIYRRSSSNRKVFEGGRLVSQKPQRTQTKRGIHLALGSLFRLDERYAVFFEPRYVFYNVNERLTGTVRYFTLRLGMDVQLN